MPRTCSTKNATLPGAKSSSQTPAPATRPRNRPRPASPASRAGNFNSRGGNLFLDALFARHAGLAGRGRFRSRVAGAGVCDDDFAPGSVAFFVEHVLGIFGGGGPGYFPAGTAPPAGGTRQSSTFFHGA